MLKIKNILFLLLATFFVFSSVCVASSETAQPDSSSKTTDENNGTTQISLINTDLYLANNNVVIEDVVDGNVFVYGQSVDIKGKIEGDLFVCTNALTIEEQATISGNVFAYAGDFVLNGKVNDIYVACNTFTLGDSGIINRDLKLYGSDCKINGHIFKDTYVYANSISFKENAQGLISGNLHYTAKDEINIPEGVIGGETKFSKIESNSPTPEQIFSIYLRNFINVFAYALVVILIVVFLTSNFADKLTYCLSKRSFATAAIGIIGIIFIPILAFLCIVTGFFIYIGVALFAVYFLILSFTISILSIAIGNYIAKKLKNNTKTKTILLSLASCVVIWLLQKLPYVGTWLSLFTIVFGLGLVLFALFIRKDVNIIGESK